MVFMRKPGHVKRTRCRGSMREPPFLPVTIQLKFNWFFNLIFEDYLLFNYAFKQ